MVTAKVFLICEIIYSIIGIAGASVIIGKPRDPLSTNQFAFICFMGLFHIIGFVGILSLLG